MDGSPYPTGYNFDKNKKNVNNANIDYRNIPVQYMGPQTMNNFLIPGNNFAVVVQQPQVSIDQHILPATALNGTSSYQQAPAPQNIFPLNGNHVPVLVPMQQFIQQQPLQQPMHLLMQQPMTTQLLNIRLQPYSTQNQQLIPTVAAHQNGGFIPAAINSQPRSFTHQPAKYQQQEQQQPNTAFNLFCQLQANDKATKAAARERKLQEAQQKVAQRALKNQQKEEHKAEQTRRRQVRHAPYQLPSQFAPLQQPQLPHQNQQVLEKSNNLTSHATPQPQYQHQQAPETLIYPQFNGTFVAHQPAAQLSEPAEESMIIDLSSEEGAIQQPEPNSTLCDFCHTSIVFETGNKMIDIGQHFQKCKQFESSPQKHFAVHDNLVDTPTPNPQENSIQTANDTPAPAPERIFDSIEVAATPFPEQLTVKELEAALNDDDDQTSSPALVAPAAVSYHAPNYHNNESFSSSDPPLQESSDVNVACPGPNLASTLVTTSDRQPEETLDPLESFTCLSCGVIYSNSESEKLTQDFQEHLMVCGMGYFDEQFGNLERTSMELDMNEDGSYEQFLWDGAVGY
jgi:hypothetical protein